MSLSNKLVLAGWPEVYLRVALTLIIAILVIVLVQKVFDSSTKNGSSSNTNDNNIKIKKGFRFFQFQYLSVYLIIMLADWLQGTNMYTLYKSYDVDIGTLFLTGFLSSAVFGTFLGIYVDRWGRKLGCIIFCILEIVINLLEHIPSMPALIVGRILGGLSTSLLFSAFESWMVSEHRKNGFDEELLSSTFAISSWGNGIVAIAAGIFAQVASDARGDIGPFQLAIFLTFITLLAVLSWRENYGNEEGLSSITKSIATSAKVIKGDVSILFLGLSQSFFEGAIYTFVFMWVPSMLQVTNNLPTGLVFSCFMLSMTLGGILFSLLLPIFPYGAEGLTIFVYLTAAAAMAVPIFKFEFWWVFISFLVLEAMVGMFNSCGAILRSRYYPEELQSSIMSVFRLPLNLLVVLGTKLTDKANTISSLKFVFGVIVVMHLTAFLLQIALVANPLKVKRKIQ